MAEGLTQAKLSRRGFLGACLTGGAAALAGWRQTIAQAAKASEVTSASRVLMLQDAMASWKFTSRDLVQAYLARIAQLNPLLSAVIETNPDALALASARDDERRRGMVRGPLHGIPILLKDNIATADAMQTTAGSLALLGSRPPQDAEFVSRLRAAGAIILGKANMSEWANFRGTASINGWSARGGFTRNAYDLAVDPGGSSSGSAVALAASLTTLAIGTETLGSILTPAAASAVVGLRPTWGLIASDGVIPIARSVDTAGPMAACVADAAILLGVIQTPFAEAANRSLPKDYTAFLQRGALSGARIGLDRLYFTAEFGAKAEVLTPIRDALNVMKALGAILVATDTGDLRRYSEPLSTVLKSEFKPQIRDYLLELGNPSLNGLADLIAFNRAHCQQEMKYFGQEVFEASEATSGNLATPGYLEARAWCTQIARTQGIEAALQRDNLDAIVAPGASLAVIPPAAAGCPSLSLPVGLTATGKPAALWIYGGLFSEPQLLAFAFDLERALPPRPQPAFLNGAPPEPPDARICS